MGSTPKAPPPPPPPPPPAPLPDPESETNKKSAQKRIARKQSESGRVSTILSDRETLG